MSQMTKCDEGHFYDKSQNSNCPFCGVGSMGPTVKYHDAEPGPTSKYPQDDDKTRQYESPAAASRRAGADDTADAEKTKALWGGGIDPVVGWLVCHEGANQGRDYRIRSGFNNIGRDISSQICIAGDTTISRVEHARIFYDPEDGSFHLTSGSGRAGVYLNGHVVLQPVVLKAYDILKMGATKLVFVPFCGDRFRWDMGATKVVTPKPLVEPPTPPTGKLI